MEAWSIADVPEHSLVDLLFDHLHQFERLAIPPLTPWPCHVRKRVLPRDLGLPASAFGDVDALLVPHDDISQCRAVEFKRIRITSKTFQAGVPNKLGELTRALTQANELSRVGFACVWLQVLVVTDSRGLNPGRLVFQGPTGRMIEMVRERLDLNTLAPNVGVCILELTQPTDRPVFETGMMGGSMLRTPAQAHQPRDLTERVRLLVSPLAS